MFRTHTVFPLAMALCLASALTVHAAPIARWTFDEADGDTAADSVGTVDGTLLNGAMFAPGQGVAGGCVDLDTATSDVVSMGDHFAFVGTEGFSAQAWVRTTMTTGALILGRHVSTVVAGYWMGINDTNDGAPNEVVGSYHFYQSDNPPLNSGDVGITDGEWHQLVAVRDAAASKLRIYVDGVRVPGASSTDDLRSLGATTAPFTVGGLVVGSTLTGSFTGCIDEVRLWDHALTDDEVSYHFEHPTTEGLLCGDTSGDGKITAADALFALKSAIGSETCATCVCDVDGGGTVGAADALAILKVAVGISLEFGCPVCG